jgi:hypothetical protein
LNGTTPKGYTLIVRTFLHSNTRKRSTRHRHRPPERQAAKRTSLQDHRGAPPMAISSPRPRPGCTCNSRCPRPPTLPLRLTPPDLGGVLARLARPDILSRRARRVCRSAMRPPPGRAGRRARIKQHRNWRPTGSRRRPKAGPQNNPFCALPLTCTESLIAAHNGGYARPPYRKAGTLSGRSPEPRDATDWVWAAGGGDDLDGPHHSMPVRSHGPHRRHRRMLALRGC